MFQLLVLIALALLCTAAAEKDYPFQYVNISYFTANSGCKGKTAQATDVFKLNQCYGGYMYNCDYSGTSITYMNYGQVNCAGSYPKTYGLPGEMCLSPVYAYSKFDSFFHCY